MPTSPVSWPRLLPSMPDLVVAVAGTGTEVGKTWITAAVASSLRAAGVRVAARKPAQSFRPGDLLDSEVLAAATGELPGEVCLAHRSYPVPMAPPMAAAALGRPTIALRDLIAELAWPAGVAVGFVETAGGVRSPIAEDADCAAFVRAITPAAVVLVADAGLGTINLVRLAAGALEGAPLVVVLNRYDGGDDLHRRNRAWLAERDGFDVVVTVAEVVDRLRVGGESGA